MTSISVSFSSLCNWYPPSVVAYKTKARLFNLWRARSFCYFPLDWNHSNFTNAFALSASPFFFCPFLFLSSLTPLPPLPYLSHCPLCLLRPICPLCPPFYLRTISKFRCNWHISIWSINSHKTGTIWKWCNLVRIERQFLIHGKTHLKKKALHFQARTTVDVYHSRKFHQQG